jgi:hypothetical protein
MFRIGVANQGPRIHHEIGGRNAHTGRSTRGGPLCWRRRPARRRSWRRKNGVCQRPRGRPRHQPGRGDQSDVYARPRIPRRTAAPGPRGSLPAGQRGAKRHRVGCRTCGNGNYRGGVEREIVTRRAGSNPRSHPGRGRRPTADHDSFQFPVASSKVSYPQLTTDEARYSMR